MKPIPGFPGYQITEDGKIYNPKGKLLTRKDEWEGYPRARLKNEEGKFVNRKIHRLVALAHLGVKDGEIRHLDNNRSNVSVHNLEWGDRFSNAKDRLDRGSYHFPTILVKGKSLLVLGNSKYLDPEKKKVYQVTDHPIGEDGAIPVTSLEKVAKHNDTDQHLSRLQNIINSYIKAKQQEKKASALYPKVHKDIFERFHPIELIKNNRKEIQRNFVSKKLYDVATKGNKQALSLMKEHEQKLIGTPKQRMSSYLNSGGFKQASWTSKKNADVHAKKHANQMGMTDEEYLKSAKESLKGKQALISVKNDVHKSRDEKNNILIHKNGKIISYYPTKSKELSKVAYKQRVRRHLERSLTNLRDWDYHQDVASTAIDVKSRKKDK